MKLNYLISTCEKNNILITSYRYEKNNYPVKMRYEFYGENKQIIYNKYMYIKSWDNFYKIYKLINQKDKHFYEMIDEKCKFFLDIDGKYIQSNNWYFYIDIIEKLLIKFFKNELNIEIKIIKCESEENENEIKKSCHIIVPEYCFLVEDCKYLCEKFIYDNIKDEGIKNIIDTSVYGRNRSLRIPYSTKINSNRVKKVSSIYYEDSFITNISKTNFITIKNKNDVKNLNNKKNKNKFKINNFDGIDENSDNYIKYLEMINNAINENKKTFKIRKDGIMGNMIICDRILPSYCKVCNQEHENENPFIIVKEDKNKLYLYCRRNPKATIYNILKTNIDKNIVIFNDIKIIIFLENIKKIVIIQNFNVFIVDIIILFIQLYKNKTFLKD